MTITPGTYRLGPDTGTLSIRTGRTGAIAKAGHDLLIEVGAWGATVDIAADVEASVVELNADSTSLRVREGTGGMKALDDDDKAGIARTIDEEILKGTPIVFRSRSVRSTPEGRFRVEGDLELGGGVHGIDFEISIGEDGRLTGSAVVKQTLWGLKPYTALFGTLKVADEVQVLVDARLVGV